jgi:NAD(P)H dehydrogenase (quinone)
MGCEVKISDLHAMKWDGVNDRRNYLTAKDDKRWSQQAEEIDAVARGTFNPQIKAEMDKIEWCDVMILQFPIHWFGLPALLKSWVDKVFAFGFAYASGKWYNRGVFRDKKAMLSLTTGAPDFFYKFDSIQGSIDEILFPINHGILYFCGFQVCEPFVTFCPVVSADYRSSELARLEHCILDFESIQMIKYPTLEDTAVPGDEAATQVPKEAVDMISTCNIMMKAWCDNDGATYSSICSNYFQMNIPAFNINAVRGFEAVWAIRASMGAEALHPHILNSHSFTSQHQVHCYCEVINKDTGKRLQLSEVTITFDPKNHSRILQYDQNNLFMAK